MKCENWNCWKDCINLVLKAVFVGVFTWGVCSAVCCMKSCDSASSCDKTQTTCCSSKTDEAAKPCSSKK
tara:strand:- start:25 stop:231 length:207 start_codon:yes stop_codon:yes gene_type:complete